MRSLVPSIILLLIAAAVPLQAQIFSDAFNADLSNWTVTGAWVWDANGAADGITNVDWDRRTSIRSASRGGAALFANPETDGQLTSQIVTVPAGTSSAFLSFYTYYRSEGGNPRVVIINSGAPVQEVTLLTELQSGQESSAGYFSIIDLSDLLAAGITSFQIQFDVEGATDFWLLDDVNLTEDRPNRPSFPSYLSASLSDVGIPFIVDSTGAPAVPNQLVADFLPGVSPADRQAFRDIFKARVLRTCVCDRIELWELPGGIFFDPNTGEPLGDPSDILERTVGSGAMNEVDGLDLNYYSYNDLQTAPAGPNPPLTADDIAFLPPATNGAIKVAVLDTGLDLDHPDFNGFLFRDSDPLGDGNDDDDDCYPDNPIGWNFVDGNNNPDDNNGHGTHVSGIIADNVRPCSDCVVQIVPYKTHNNFGVGTLFATTCATLQASVEAGVDIINASWGFYGGTSEILLNAIDTANSYGATFVTAAGNDSLNLVADPQFPATYPLANIISVGAVDTLPLGTFPFANFSNYHADYVDIAAFGVEVESSLPGGGRGLKSGTSMSTPAVSAAAAIYGCEQGGELSGVKAYLLANALTGGADLNNLVLDLNVLSPNPACEDPTSIGATPTISATFSARPNPAFTEFLVEALTDMGAAEISLYQLSGVLIETQRVSRFNRGMSVTFKVDELPAGQYLVTISAGGRLRTQRLVKR
ncbi:MAG: S8 family peptidase [Bacteroidota bacterium]